MPGRDGAYNQRFAGVSMWIRIVCFLFCSFGGMISCASKKGDNVASVATNSPQPPISIVPGKVRFEVIPTISNADWWKTPEGEESVWKEWDRSTYYVWGANPTNMWLNKPSEILNGSGMASAQIMARGHGHSHYIGMNTVTADGAGNAQVFTKLQGFLQEGSDLVFPTYHDAFSLGSGAAADSWLKKSKDWYQSQAGILGYIDQLIKLAQSTIYPTAGMMWVDKKGKMGNQVVHSNVEFTALWKAVQAEADKP